MQNDRYKKININIPHDLLAQIDDEADKKHMTRTAYMLNAIQLKLDADRFLEKQPDIMRKMQELQGALEEVAQNSDKDFAGIFGQERIDYGK